MTEIPEHLLKRSKDAKARMLGTPVEDSKETPTEVSSQAVAKSSAITPAKANATPSPDLPYLDSPPEKTKPQPSHVTQAKSRGKIPYWALPVVVSLPVWAWGFAGTMQQPEREDPLFDKGAELYNSCSNCHGSSGGGGSGYQLSGGSVLETFPDPVDQMVHVARGSAEINGEQYGAERSNGERRTSGAMGNMPAQQDSLSLEELEMVVFHERAVLSGEDTSQPGYQEWMDHMREAYESGTKTEDYLDLLLACANPEVTPGASGVGSDNPDEPCPGPKAEIEEEV